MRTDSFSHSEIEQALSQEPYGYPLYYFKSTGSTNEEAIKLACDGAPTGTIVVANEQTAGRGRGDRQWYTPASSGLAVSIILRPALPSRQISHVALLGAIATVQAIKSISNLQPKLKWPNDVWINGKKVAGILGESSHGTVGTEWVVLGIGINVSSGPPAGTTTRHPFSCLEEQSGHPIDRLELLRELIGAVSEHSSNIGTKTLVSIWEKHMMWRGKRVCVLNPDGTSTDGNVLGIDSDGALLLDSIDGIVRHITAGDISRTNT